ncbi:MAG: glycosyltransferase [Spirulinaceae cyanobacterium RM2_2_10]|nr:glycosyltransferase [Spirulinaceae cyanobacterium SM2_1_0]NJO20772.1 glycosyltransferase [Spirulinaceae cyanobacterium RM2_2_10]
MAIALTGLLLILTFGSLAFYLACALLTWRFFRRSPEAISNLEMPPVSLMVPVCGLDAGAWENWLSLCCQDYPDYEILFGVKDADDPAVPLLEKLVATFPERVRLYIDLPARGSNYKDSNLSYLLEAAQHEMIIFADSDIRVRPDYLRIAIAPLADPQVGLVTCAFTGRNPQSLGSALAYCGRCIDFIPSALIARALDGGLRFAVGVTLATRQTTLAAAGGLHLSRIGSDYNLGKRIAQAGYRVELSPYVLDWDTGDEGVAAVYQRELRWARTIRYNRGPIYYTMIFCYGSLASLLLLPVSGWASWAIALSLLTWVGRYLQAWVAIYYLDSQKLLPWLWALPFRDLLSLAIWAVGSYGRRVRWRGRWLRVEGDGLIRRWET